MENAKRSVATTFKPFRLVLREPFQKMVDDELWQEMVGSARPTDEDGTFRLRLNRDFLAALREENR